MAVFFRSVMAVFLAGLLFLSVACAQGGYVANFYGRLAEIIEQNMDSPDVCVEQAEAFIKDNIQPLVDEMDKASAQQDEQEAFSEEADQAEGEMTMEMAMEEVDMQALQKFMEVYTSFSISNPEQAQKISECMSSYETPADEE